MKKHLLCAVVMAALTLSACGQEEAVFTLTAAQQEQYTQLMEEVAEEYYWDFDGDSLRFAAGVVPENTEENADFFAACAETDYNMTSYAGTEVVVGTANLMHYNGDAAGQLMCYFPAAALWAYVIRGDTITAGIASMPGILTKPTAISSLMKTGKAWAPVFP